MKPLSNIQDYIDSGILEQFVLGLTTSEQNEEILYYKNQHPEILEALQQIENTLEQFGSAFAQPMPQAIKQNVLNEIRKKSKNTPFNKNQFLKLFSIFSMILLGLGIIYLILKFNKSQKRIEHLEKNIAVLDSLRIQDSLALYDCNHQLLFIKDIHVKKINLQGTKLSPQALAQVYYNKNGKEIILDDLSLPIPTPDRQYQLWAIVGDKPVDLGVFDLEDKPIHINLDFDQIPSAFAITLEPKGGNVSPSLDMMYLLGKVEN